MRVMDARLSSDKAAMDDESGIVKSERPRRPSVTNINIFALAPVAAPHASMAEPVLEHDENTETLVSPQWLERRNSRLDTLEQELRRRAADLDAREAELEQREAELEAEAFIRSEALEEREQRLAELDRRLGRREHELSSYVARVQGGMLRADAL
jgi:Skp family chaperone for outer membrane proteins